jgi:hypothetical protein
MRSRAPERALLRLLRAALVIALVAGRVLAGDQLAPALAVANCVPNVSVHVDGKRL